MSYDPYLDNVPTKEEIYREEYAELEAQRDELLEALERLQGMEEGFRSNAAKAFWNSRNLPQFSSYYVGKFDAYSLVCKFLRSL